MQKRGQVELSLSFLGKSSQKERNFGKKSQVTTFIILGIVLLAAIAFIFFLRNQIVEQVLGPEGTKRIISTQLGFINDHIKKCIDDTTKPALELLGKQGGSFNPVKYRLYNGSRVNYLCYNIPNSEKCLNQMLLRSKLENELNNYLKNEIYSCIDINSLKSDKFNIIEGTFSLTTTVNDENVLVSIDYPLTLERKGITANLREFSKGVDVPLGKLVQPVNDILNSEATTGDFNVIDYLRKMRSAYDIVERKVVHDKVYIVNVLKDPYQFYIAIEGEA